MTGRPIANPTRAVTKLDNRVARREGIPNFRERSAVP